MKKIAIVSVLLTTLAGCSASVAEAKEVETVSTAIEVTQMEQSLWNDYLIGQAKEIERQREIEAEKIENAKRIDKVTEKLLKHVGKTWYVFGGNTPRGWDCSGLVAWYYRHFDIELPHVASGQKYSGKPHKFSVEKAMRGDIIWFPGHVGIYDGDGYMIHSPHPGARTERVKVLDWARDNWTTHVTYTRLIDVL